MAYMVKNPSLMPSLQTIMEGEIGHKRAMVANMLDGFWDSCLRPGPVTDLPFVADAIIANPPSFAHVHCAQALGIPVPMMFTMPWSPTKAFPHPLANLANASDDRGWANLMSHHLVEWMTWQGLGDVINAWRQSVQLEPVNMADGPSLTQKLKIPFTYCWSPSLVPKPDDWPDYIDVCGFFFRENPTYTPPDDLDRFLGVGPPPVYLGFGSIVLDDPANMLHMILEAVRAAGVRAIISKGWSKFEGDDAEDIYYIGECPHEWLFPRMAAVVHHGGAGTTACGIKNAIPTIIVPFFGDQPFWGHMVASAGVGPEPLVPSSLTAARLAQAIELCLDEHVREAARLMAQRMQHETGVQAAVQSFHRHLDAKALQCDLMPDQAAVWTCKAGKKRVKISKLAAEAIAVQRPSFAKQLKLYQSKPLTIEVTRWDPISGGASAVLSTALDMTACITGMATRPAAEYREEKRRRARAEELDRFVQTRRQARVDVSSDKASIRTARSSQHRRDATKLPSIGGKAAAAGALSIGSMAPRALKGMTVDILLAIAEGLRSLPAHYGDDVKHDHGQVTDIGSGFAVAGKSFAWGFMDGVSDLAVQPYRDVKQSGAKGLATGLGKGVVGLAAKSGAGMFGLLAYPASGIAKSLRSATHTQSRKSVEAARRDEGDWLLQCAGMDKDQLASTVERFDGLSGSV